MPTDGQIIRHLAERVMGWKRTPTSWYDGDKFVAWAEDESDGISHAGPTQGHRGWNPLDSWDDAGMVWERAREMGISIALWGERPSWVATFPAAKSRYAGKAQADSGPRAICLAVYRATGGEDAK